MKKWYTLSLVFIALIIYSCRKDQQINQTTDHALTVASAKSLYESNKQDYTGNPDWKKAYFFQQSDTASTLKVPLQTDIGYRELVFEQHQSQNIQTYVLHAVPNPDYIIQKEGENPTVTNIITLLNVQDYTGGIYRFQTDGKFVEGSIYENGKLLNMVEPTGDGYKKKKSDGKVLDGGGTGDMDCNNPIGPWIVLCNSLRMLPPVTITAPRIIAPLPPVGVPGPPIGGGRGPALSTADLAHATYVDNGVKPIDPAKFIKCFTDGKTASKYIMTIYVQQPVPGKNDQWRTDLNNSLPGGQFYKTPGGNF